MIALVMYIFLIIFCGIPLYSMYDDVHFYRAAALFSEPRFDRDWLATFECNLGGGSADTGFTKKGIKLPLSDSFFLLELYMIYIQNIVQGFFIDIVVPIRSIEITPKSPRKPLCCCIPIAAEERTTAGDLMLHMGYSYSYQNTTHLDFIDGTIRVGLLLPTSPITPISTIFWTIPIGYNGSIGIPLSGDVSCGAYEWLTMAIHIGVMPLIPTSSKVNIQCSPCAIGEPRSFLNAIICYVGMFIKADHIMRGISGTLGYSYTQRTTYSDKNIQSRLISMDFAMHTLHVILEYDCLRQEYWFGPRVALLYNHILAGHSIIHTDMIYGQWGFELSWQFG